MIKNYFKTAWRIFGKIKCILPLTWVGCLSYIDQFVDFLIGWTSCGADSLGNSKFSGLEGSHRKSCQ
jgi:hypothetical protein